MEISPLRNVPIRKSISRGNLLEKGVPREYIESKLNDYPINKEVSSFFRRYLENIELMHKDNVSLLLYGANGNGKTWLSSLVVKEAYIFRFTSKRITLQNFIDMQFQKDVPSVMAKIDYCITCDFLVVDEIGKETFSKNGFNITVFEELLRQRETNGRPTIICTNLHTKDLYSNYGASIESLISGNYIPVKFNTDDNRQNVTKRKQAVKLLLEGN